MNESTPWTPRREDIAWAAGIFEGEGSTGTYTSAGIRACVDMTDEDVVRKFARIVRLGSVVWHDKKRVGWKDSWRWQVHGYEKVQALMAMFWPWLGERRKEQVRTAFAKALAGTRSPDSYLVRRMFGKPLKELTPQQYTQYLNAIKRRSAERKVAASLTESQKPQVEIALPMTL